MVDINSLLPGQNRYIQRSQKTTIVLMQLRPPLLTPESLVVSPSVSLTGQEREAFLLVGVILRSGFLKMFQRFPLFVCRPETAFFCLRPTISGSLGPKGEILFCTIGRGNVAVTERFWRGGWVMCLGLLLFSIWIFTLPILNVFFYLELGNRSW